MTPTAFAPPTKPLFANPQLLTRGEIQDVTASPDGRWLAVASAGGLYLHDAQTLAFERALLEDVWVAGAAFSPDSRWLAVHGKGWLRLIDLSGPANGPQQAQPVQASALKVDFAADGKRLLSLDGSGVPARLSYWVLPLRQERQVALDVADAPLSMALSPSGKCLAVGGASGWVELFDLQSAARLAVLSEWTGRAVTDLAFSRDGSSLAAAEASAEGRVRVWSVDQRKRLVEQYASGYNSIQPFVAFSADGQRLLGGMGDLAVLWDRRSGQPIQVLGGYASSLMDLEISPQGDRLAYATYHWPAYVRDLAGDAAPLVLSAPYYQTFNVAFSPGGESVATGLYSYAPEPKADEPPEMTRVWNAASGEPLRSYAGASAAAFHPQATALPGEGMIALADSRGILRVDDLTGDAGVCLPGCDCGAIGKRLESGSCTLELPHSLSPMKLAYSPDGGLLSVWGVVGTWSAAGLINMDTGEEAAWFEGGSRISFGPNSLIALGVDELNPNHGIAAHWLVLYDLATGQEVRRVELPAAGVAALSADGRWLAVGLSSFEKTNSGGQDPPDPAQNGLMIWDVAAWRQVAYFPVHYGITRLAFSRQGDFLIAAAETGAILRWNISP
jgi:WD40 repeat protein